MQTLIFLVKLDLNIFFKSFDFLRKGITTVNTKYHIFTNCKFLFKKKSQKIEKIEQENMEN